MWLNTVRFKDRLEAGELLVDQLISDQVISESKKKNLLILAVPRGGVVVGKVVADRLGLPLGVVVTKKVGAPGQEELAVGAMGPDGKVVWDKELMARLGLSPRDLRQQIRQLAEKIQNYKSKFPTSLKSSTLRLRPEGLRGTSKIILVDDGVATGSTMLAAIGWLRRKCKVQSAKCKIIVAIPVCAKEAYEKLESLADKIVCLAVPEDFGAVGQFYEYFPQVTDEEVIDILQS